MQYERYPNELAHYGVKGMKWGIRKQRINTTKDYRNKNKSFSEILKKSKTRVNKSSEKIQNIGEKVSNASKETKDDRKNINNLTQSGKNIADSLNRFTNMHTQSKKQPAKHYDLSNLTDNDLRNAVNRMQLENQYISLKSARENKQTETGMQKVSKYISVAAEVGVVVGNAVGIAMTINKLRGK